jgi:hypothetical protein
VLVSHMEKAETKNSHAFSPAEALNGKAWSSYRALVDTSEGEWLALRRVNSLLTRYQQAPLSQHVTDAVTHLELSAVIRRMAYLDSWHAELMRQIPKISELVSKSKADKVFDAFVKSKFPYLVTREGELAKLETRIRSLVELGISAQSQLSQLSELAEDFGHYSHALLEARVKQQ